MSNVVNLQEFREKQRRERMSKAVKNADIDGVIDEFLFDLDQRFHKDEVNCSFTLESGERFDFQLSTEEYPLPVTEQTLYGWSVKVWNYNQQQWITLPDFFETEEAAYDQAELIMKSLDEGSKND